MKKIITCLMAALGLTSACGQEKHYEDVDVNTFAALADDPEAILLDVRSAAEYAEGHIEGAINIDQGQGDFMQKAKAMLAAERTIAVYCRSGRRSASTANRLAQEGYRCKNLKGGITAWKEAGRPVTTDTYEVDVFKTKSGRTVRFHALVHASIRIEYDGRQMQIDPVARLGNKVINYAAMPKADYLLVTHEHGDHYDPAAIKTLTGQTTRIVTNKRCCDMLADNGSATRTECMKNGDTIQLADDITVEAVPAYNTTEGHLQFHPKGRDNGYIITIDGLRIYVAGDTEDIPEMDGISNIDIAFMPCNQPYTMTTQQLVRAAKTVKPRVLFPYHYGQTDVSGLPEQLSADGIDVRIRHYE